MPKKKPVRESPSKRPFQNESTGPMTFWSSRDFKQNLQTILPRKKDRDYLAKDIGERVRESSLELSLGEEVFISSQKRLERLTEDNDIVKIEPADFGLLVTKEWVEIPGNCMGFISIKSKHKLSGLINISGFHVDPGFRGRLKFSVYNAGTTDVILRYGERTFIIFITYIRGGSEPKEGAHWDQEHIEPKEMMPLLGGAGITVHDIVHRLGTVETMVKIYGGVLIGIFLLLLKWAFSS